MPRSITPAATLALAFLTGCAAITGCAPQPEASPTPSSRFTNEAEAYRAAEETYRAYVDASNRIDLKSPATFEPVYKLETGDALASDKKTFTSYYSSGVTKTGDVILKLTAPREIDMKRRLATLDVCQDVSQVEVTDADGNSLVSPDRSRIQSLLVQLERSDASPTAFLVSGIWHRTDGAEC